MARVAWIVPSNEVFNNNEKKLVIDAPFAEVNLINIPSQYSFTVSFGIIGLDINKDNIIKFEIGFFKDDDDKKILLEAPLHIGNPKSDEINEIGNLGLAEFISNISLKNFIFEATGLHYVKMEIDDNTQINYFNVNVSSEVNE
ncbi:hypothetical protein [Staphylococcus shinii]|uniref:hypothetical protein n=1 Tax=Staphylococcus shinii TaxID=2912228 RepID=UPI003F86E043